MYTGRGLLSDQCEHRAAESRWAVSGGFHPIMSVSVLLFIMFQFLCGVQVVSGVLDGLGSAEMQRGKLIAYVNAAALNRKYFYINRSVCGRWKVTTSCGCVVACGLFVFRSSSKFYQKG